MTITVEEEISPGFDFDCTALAKEVIAFALQHEKFPYEAEVNLTLTDNDSIQDINREYREMDRPTDVLSFPMMGIKKPGDYKNMEGDLADNFNPDTGEALLGDIIISVPKVFEQAQAYGHSVKREFAFLIVHSVLHLLGYDHMTESEAACMEEKQERILSAIDILR